MIPLIILILVFILIAIRQVGNIRLQIWQIMSAGAVIVLITGSISTSNALKSVNFDVILFLFGMFVVGEALERSGYLANLSYRYFKSAKTAWMLFLLIIFGMGLLSVFLMNDTVAIIGTPVVLKLAERNKIPATPLLLALAFSITTGSVMSPIGNPQNLIIAVNGNIPNVFESFGKYLFAPTIINLFLVLLIVRIYYKNAFNIKLNPEQPAELKNEKLAKISKFSLGLILFLTAAKVILLLFKINIDFKLTYIALAAALPIVLFSSERIEIIKKVDWHTIIFFISMFILMQSVWDTGIFQAIIRKSDVNIMSLAMILIISVLLSQLISNVPLVALYLPLLMGMGVSTRGLMSLAAGSTIAGNLFILGAASNIIIIQNAEKRNGETITFYQFTRLGLPLTVVNVLVYYLFLRVL